MANIDAQKAYDEIIERCRDLRDGKFILSSKNISRLLSSIVSHQESYSYLIKCNETYTYGNELNLAVGEETFVLPLNKHKIIVLVTGLLRQFLLFESKAGVNKADGIDFYLFLRKYYPSIDVDKSFSLFVDAVIFPYAKAFKGMIDDDGEVEMTIEDGHEWIEKLSDNVKEQLYPCINSLNELIVADNHMNEEKKTECLIMIEGFNHVLELGNTKLINVVFIGLKNTFAGYKEAENHIKFIKEMLTSFKSIS